MSLHGVNAAHRNAKRPFLVIGQLLSVDSATRRATVSINGGAAVSLPYFSDDPSDNLAGFTTAGVVCDPAGPQWVIGGSGAQIQDVQPPPPPPDTPGTVTRTVTITPTWSGTWRALRSDYDRWNVTRYGGRSDLYQSQIDDSGPLMGVASYGNQFVNLGATSIDKAVLSVPLSNGSGTVVVQGLSTGGSSPSNPNPSGPTASGKKTIALGSSIRADLLSGDTRSLALVGSDYLAVRGIKTANGMSVAVTYTRGT